MGYSRLEDPQSHLRINKYLLGKNKGIKVVMTLLSNDWAFHLGWERSGLQSLLYSMFKHFNISYAPLACCCIRWKDTGSNSLRLNKNLNLSLLHKWICLKSFKHWSTAEKQLWDAPGTILWEQSVVDIWDRGIDNQRCLRFYHQHFLLAYPYS